MGGKSRRRNHKQNDDFVLHSQTPWSHYDQAPSQDPHLGSDSVRCQPKSNFSNDNPFQRGSSQRDRISKPSNPLHPPLKSNHHHHQNEAPRNFNSTSFFLKSLRLKQHLLRTIDRNFRQIMEWCPDEVVEDGMDWQPEDEVVIPQVEDVKYCWDRRSIDAKVAGVEKVGTTARRQASDCALDLGSSSRPDEAGECSVLELMIRSSTPDSEVSG